MRLITVLVVGLCGFVLVPTARAVNPSWATGYPKTGTAAGTILVKGEINMADTLETTGAARIQAWLVGGGPMNNTDFTVPAGMSGVVTWGEAATNNNLTAGSQYNVVVSIEVKVKATGMRYFMSTDPATAAAK